MLADIRYLTAPTDDHITPLTLEAQRAVTEIPVNNRYALRIVPTRAGGAVVSGLEAEIAVKPWRTATVEAVNVVHTGGCLGTGAGGALVYVSLTVGAWRRQNGEAIISE